MYGVSVRRTSPTGANAETISDTGDHTAFSVAAPSSVQRVRMDSESLPTGMAISSAGHNSMPTARTVR